MLEFSQRKPSTLLIDTSALEMFDVSLNLNAQTMRFVIASNNINYDHFL